MYIVYLPWALAMPRLTLPYLGVGLLEIHCPAHSIFHMQEARNGSHLLSLGQMKAVVHSL